MAQNRPNKPSVTLPDNFGGVKSEFSASKISNGYESSTSEIVEGGNLNYMLDGLFRNTKYMRTVLDYVRDTPVGKMFWVNSSGQMDYIQPAVIATNVEFDTGTATDKTPNVKQVVDKLATKANNNSVVHLTGAETITGPKTFAGNGSVSYIENTSVTYNTAPESRYYTNIVFTDKNNAEMGVVGVMRDTNNSTTIQLNARGANGDWSGQALRLTVASNGTVTANAPGPTDTTSTSSKQIATVGWVNTVGNNVVHKTGNETIDGTKTLSASPIVPTLGNADNSTKAATTAFVHNILAALYPVGSIYIGTQSTCPLASLISGSTWAKIAGDRVLQSSSSNHAANTAIAAGLPDITGTVNLSSCSVDAVSGAFQKETTTSGVTGGSSSGKTDDFSFKASNSNSIYGSSSTVQPPAYVVNVWRRTA